MKIVNSIETDYHLHSMTFSDGVNTIDEIVNFAGKIGMKEIAITDHSQAYLTAREYPLLTHYKRLERWENVHNDVNVIFGVEADILNKKGDISCDIQGYKPEFIILSAHPQKPYKGDPAKITTAYLNAINKHREKIKFLSHPCALYFEEFIEIEPIIELCNEKGLPLEFNCTNFLRNKTNLKNLGKMLRTANRIIVNSDAHTLHEMKSNRVKGWNWLKKEGFLTKSSKL